MEPTTCEFCQQPIPDPMLGFLDHMESSPVCNQLWNEWRRNVRREAGGT